MQVMTIQAVSMNYHSQFAIFCDNIEKKFESFWVNLGATFSVLFVWTIVILIWISDQPLPIPHDRQVNPHSIVFWLLIFFLVIIFGIALNFGMEGWSAVVLAVWLMIGFLISFYDPAVLYDDKTGLGALTKVLREFWPMGVVLASVYWFFVNWHTLHFVFQGDRLIKQYWGLFLVQILMYSVLYGVHFVFAVPIVLTMPHYFFRKWLIGKHDGDKVKRGTVILTDIQANRPYREMLRHNPEPTITLGNLTIPLREATKHILIAGMTGSGKTLTLRIALRSIVDILNTGTGRMIIYDATQQTLALLRGLGLRCPVYDLNPFHEGTCWHISRDCTSPADAEALTQSIILEPMQQDKGDSFWKNSAALLFRGVIEFLMLNAPGAWDLRDVCCCFSNEALLSAILRSDPRTAHYLDEALEKTDKTLSGIVQTIRAQTGQLQILAALWHRATHRISLKEWMTQNAVIMIGRDERAKITLNAVNNLILGQFTQLLMSQPSLADGGSAEYFVVVDELGNFRMSCLEQLATEGRGRKVSLMCAIQDVAQLRETYGPHKAEIIANQFTHKALLKCSGESAEWASRVLGDVELRRTTSSWDWQSTLLGLFGWGNKTGMAETIATVRAAIPSEFEAIPPVNAKTGLTGYYVSIHKHKHTYPDRTLQQLLVPPAPCPGYSLAPEDWQWLEPWSAEDDGMRLNIFPLIRQVEQQTILQHLQKKASPPPIYPPGTTDEEEEWIRSLGGMTEPPDEEEESQTGTSTGYSSGGLTPTLENTPTPNQPPRPKRLTSRLKKNRPQRQRPQQQRGPHER